MNINDMTIFNPLTDKPNDLPNHKGLYIITANNISCLPDILKEAEYKFYEERPIIYVGMSNRGFRARDYKNHFKGTARNSTLRKSLGVFMLLNKEYEVNNPLKYKFKSDDERSLTMWMMENLWLHYLICENPEEIEKQLINELSPPLNLKDNHNEINKEIRRQLKAMRNNKKN